MKGLSGESFLRKAPFILIYFFIFLTICVMGIVLLNSKGNLILRSFDVDVMYLSPEVINANIYKNEDILYIDNPDKYCVIGIPKDLLYGPLNFFLVIQLSSLVVSLIVISIIKNRVWKFPYVKKGGHGRENVYTVNTFEFETNEQAQNFCDSVKDQIDEATKYFKNKGEVIKAETEGSTVRIYYGERTSEL